MRSFLTIGLAASVLAAAAASPALANPPDLQFKPGNGGGPIGGGHFQGGRGGPGPGAFQGGRGGFQGGGFAGRNGNGFRHFGDRGGYRRHGGFGGAAIGAGVAGLAAGALIGGAIANQNQFYDGGYGYNGYGYNGGYGYDAAPVYAAPPPPVVESDEDQVPVSGNAEAYCAARYRSYDPSSGTYLGYDGERHPCP